MSEEIDSSWASLKGKISEETMKAIVEGMGFENMMPIQAMRCTVFHMPS